MEMVAGEEFALEWEQPFEAGVSIALLGKNDQRQTVKTIEYRRRGLASCFCSGPFKVLVLLLGLAGCSA